MLRVDVCNRRTRRLLLILRDLGPPWYRGDRDVGVLVLMYFDKFRKSFGAWLYQR